MKLGEARNDGRRSAAARVEAWFLDAVPVQVMVLNRCILGAVLFLHAASRVPEFGRLYGSTSGAWSAAYRDYVSRILAAEIGYPMAPLVSALEDIAPELRQLLLVALYAGLLASSLAFALGLFSRKAGCVALFLHLFFVTVHPLAHYGWARMLVPFTLYVLLSNAGDYISLDALLLRRRRTDSRPRSGLAPAWPMRLLQIHVAAMYFHSGFSRIDDPGWLRGDVLFEALASELFSRFTLDLDPLKPALALLAYGVFLLEPMAALLLWVPRVRTLCALLLLAMHVTLELLTNVGWWNYVMIAGLLAFLPTAWVAHLLPRIPLRSSDAHGSPAMPPPGSSG